VAANGNWPGAQQAAARLAPEIRNVPTALIDVPPFKPVTAYSYPLGLLGVMPVAVPAARRLVVICDDLFQAVVGAACRGPAEAAALARAGISGPVLVDRFSPAPSRTISVYDRGTP
jgi:hypothetical protein